MKLPKMKVLIPFILILFYFLNCASEIEKKDTPEPSREPAEIETTNKESELKRKGFNDTVILKNGTVLNGVEAAVTKESLVVTSPEGESHVYSKKEVQEVKKGKADNVANTTEPEDKPSEELESDGSERGHWSAYKGYMTWDDAIEKCSRIGMRLPTKAELETAYEAGLGDEWRKEVFMSNYWSSQEFYNSYSNEYAYFIDMTYGNLSYTFKIMPFGVRCIR